MRACFHQFLKNCKVVYFASFDSYNYGFLEDTKKCKFFRRHAYSKTLGFFSTQISWHYIFGRIHNLVAFSAYTLHFELKGINRQLRGLNNSGLLLSLSSKLGRIVDFDCCLNSYEFYIFISFFFSNTNVDHKNFIAEIWTLHSWMCYSNFRKVNRLSLYRKGEETWWNINR